MNKNKDRPVRFQVEITQESLKELKDLQALAGLNAPKDVLNNALSLFRWAIKQRQEGYVVMSGSEDGEIRRILEMPALEYAARTAPKPPPPPDLAEQITRKKSKPAVAKSKRRK